MCGFHTRIVVTYAYICFSERSSTPRGAPSTRFGMLPYRYIISHGFGGVLMPAHYPYPTARLVSCYALFK